MTHLSVWTLEQARRRPPVLLPSGYWVYLGKNLDERDSLVSSLGEKGLLPLNDRLHRIAERLRQPFLNCIANLGRMQSDQLGWWSSSCSWKDGGRSDLFLLVCYEHLIDELREEWKDRDRPIVVIVEDPWLFYQLKELYANLLDVEFHGNPRLWPACLKALVCGIGARLIWSLRLIRNYLVQRWFWTRYAPRQTARPSIGLYTYPLSRCLRGDDGWTDPYLGDLDRMLEKAGHPVMRFTPPEVGGFEREVARRSRYFAPLILYATLRGFLHSLFVTWRPVWPESPEVIGLPVQRLLLREWWGDRWRSSSMIFRLFHHALSRLLQATRLKLLIFQYENQPWEKMLVMAAKAEGVRTLGYQHGGGLSRFNLGYFHGNSEAERMPLADLIVASGSYAYELMAEGGTPRERLVIGGNLRHQYLRGRRNSLPLPEANKHVRILVTLPIDEDLGRHLLYALRKAFPDGGAGEGIEFVIKPHPMCPVTEAMLKFPAAFVYGTFEEALRSSTVLLYSGTGTGLEALVMGRTVLRYRSELLLHTDRDGLLDGDSIIDCGDHDLREKVLSLVYTTSLSPSGQEVNDLLKRFFSPPDTAVWLAAIERLCPERAVGHP